LDVSHPGRIQLGFEADRAASGAQPSAGGRVRDESLFVVETDD
jgi:hypothetical protein